MTAHRPNPFLMALAASGLLMALMASKCETEFIPYVKEECGDTQDNDADGDVDCKDSDCAVACAVEATDLADDVKHDGGRR